MRYVRLLIGTKVWDIKASEVAHHYACYMHGDAGVCDEWHNAFDFCESSPTQLKLWASKHMTLGEIMRLGNRPRENARAGFENNSCCIIERH